jgi:Flp pilus assembly protein TadG
MKATSMSRIWPRTRLSVARLLHDRSGIAATEFAVIVPVMLVMFFGTVEISNGSVDRKITLTARTLSDLTSQAAPSSVNAPDAPVTDAYLQNVFTASAAIVTPYCATPTQARLSEIYVDSSLKATIQWSKAAIFAGCTTPATLTTSSRIALDVVTTLVPAKLLVKQTYLLLSEVSYLYTPAVGYVMGKAGVTLSDVAYTRPRQAVCVVYTTPRAFPGKIESGGIFMLARI